MAKIATYIAPIAGFISAIGGQFGEFVVAYGGFSVGLAGIAGSWYWNRKRYQLDQDHKRWLREQAEGEQGNAGQG